MDSPIITKICLVCKKAEESPLTIDHDIEPVRRKECKPCFNRWRQWRRRHLPPLTDRHITNFWKHVKKTSGCWVWTGTTGKRNGYGYFSAHCISLLAHRVSASFVKPDLTSDICVLHTCDNPPCVNPAHFRYGDHAANSRDMIEKGRSKAGETHWNVRLTERDVREIRCPSKRHFNNIQLAEHYGVDRQTIGDARAGRTWKHIPFD